MSYKIVIARYNEDINWLNSELKNCIIYNKGERLNIDNEIMLDNIGRESHTYLHYIITNYNNLPDVLVFTQARISDHRGSDDINYLINLKNEAFTSEKSYPYDIHEHRAEHSCWNKDWNKNKDNTYYLHNNYLNNKHILFIDWFLENIDSKYPDPIKIYWNAIFAVKKNLILKHPLEYYKKLILQVSHNSNPVEAHFFERSWYYIFN
jgi:hypothetical protein